MWLLGTHKYPLPPPHPFKKKCHNKNAFAPSSQIGSEWKMQKCKLPLGTDTTLDFMVIFNNGQYPFVHIGVGQKLGTIYQLRAVVAFSSVTWSESFKASYIFVYFYTILK